MPNVEALIKLYQRAQERIIQKILTHSTAFDRNLLNSINKELAVLQGKTVEWVEENIPKAYREGIKQIDDYYAAEYAKAGKPVPAYPSGFSVVHQKAIAALIENMSLDMEAANNHVGRKVKDNIRQASIEAIADKVSTGTTVQKTQKRLKEIYEKQGLSAIEYKRAGQTVRMNLDAYAETVARSTTAEATNRASMNEVRELGNDLVKMTTHSPTCEICLPLQGRVYSISGKSTEYPPLGRAYTGEYASIHPRCIHRLNPYIPELKTDEELARDKEISQRPFDVSEWGGKDKSQAQRSLDAYHKGQAKVRQRYADRKQYHRYKARLGAENVPKTFSGFRSMKRAGGEKWDNFERYYRLDIQGFSYAEFLKNKKVEDAKDAIRGTLPKKLGLTNQKLPVTIEVSHDLVNGVVPKSVELTDVYVISGKDVNGDIRDRYKLTALYGGLPVDWEKKVGTAPGKSFSYELHWYENTGRAPEDTFKIKRVRANT